MTNWHPHHIAERYGLFTIIVLGECVLAGATAVQATIDEDGASAELVSSVPEVSDCSSPCGGSTSSRTAGEAWPATGT